MVAPATVVMLASERTNPVVAGPRAAAASDRWRERVSGEAEQACLREGCGENDGTGRETSQRAQEVSRCHALETHGFVAHHRAQRERGVYGRSGGCERVEIFGELLQ